MAHDARVVRRVIEIAADDEVHIRIAGRLFPVNLVNRVGVAVAAVARLVAQARGPVRGYERQIEAVDRQVRLQNPLLGVRQPRRGCVRRQSRDDGRRDVPSSVHLLH